MSGRSDSWIHPLRHSALEVLSVLETSGRRAALFSRERIAEPASGGQADAVLRCSGKAFERALAAQRDWPLNWSALLFTPDSVRLETGVLGAIPIYLLEDRGSLVADYDVSRMYGMLGDAPLFDFEAAAGFLAAGRVPAGAKTLFRRIVRVAAGASADWKGQGITVVAAPESPPCRAATLRDGADPVTGLVRLLDATLDRRFAGDRSATGLELSGGLDSATLAHQLSRLSGPPLRSYGIAVSGPSRAAQLRRRSRIADAFGLADTVLDGSRHAPFQRLSDRPFVPWEEFYYEAFHELYRAMSQSGIERVVTGLGGDELFATQPWELDEDERDCALARLRSDAESVPDHLSPMARDAAAAQLRADMAEPFPALARSTLQSFASGSALYLRHGLRPVHPFGNLEVIRYCARLPLEWRSDRRVQRELLLRAGIPSWVVRPRRTETFADLMKSAIRAAVRSRIAPMFNDSRLHEMRLIDAGRFRSKLQDFAAGHGSPETDAMLLATTVLELTARSVESARQVAAQ